MSNVRWMSAVGRITDSNETSRHVRKVPILLQKSKIERRRKSRESLIFDVSAAAKLRSADAKVRSRFCVKRCCPTRRHARNASAVLKNFVRHQKKTFSTLSARSRLHPALTKSGRPPHGNALDPVQAVAGVGLLLTVVDVELDAIAGAQAVAHHAAVVSDPGSRRTRRANLGSQALRLSVPVFNRPSSSLTACSSEIPSTSAISPQRRLSAATYNCRSLKLWPESPGR
jgi:hypothetical protein